MIVNWKVIFWFALLAWVCVWPLFGANKPLPIRLADPYRDVCAPYESAAGKAWSCVPAYTVANWILSGRDR